jgi:hypothetical protein
MSFTCATDFPHKNCGKQWKNSPNHPNTADLAFCQLPRILQCRLLQFSILHKVIMMKFGAVVGIAS